MLTAEERMELDVLAKHGVKIRELAKLTGRSRNTVRRYLREGEAAARRKPARKRPEKLDPFQGLRRRPRRGGGARSHSGDSALSRDRGARL